MPHLKLSDGTVWPRPSIESDTEPCAEWKARYAPDSVTRADLMALAEIAHAYSWLLLMTNRPRRDQVCREIRQQLKAAVSSE